MVKFVGFRLTETEEKIINRWQSKTQRSMSSALHNEFMKILLKQLNEE